MVAEKGGKVYRTTEYSPISFDADVFYLIERLYTGKLDGFVLDQYTLW